MANVVVSAGGTSVIAGFITSGQINTMVSAGVGSSLIASPSKIGSILQVKGLLDSPTITWATDANDLRPDVIGLTETSGPTDLVVGAVAANELLQRVGSTIVGIPLSSVGVTDHGVLTGLLDNDHPQYIDGSLAFTGDLDMGANAITNVGLVDGVDISVHEARHSDGGADEITADDLGSGAATIGQVLTADGSGGNDYGTLAVFSNSVGIGTTAPTHAMTFAQGEQLSFYDTVDQVTNFERLVISNVGDLFAFRTSSGGTGVQQQLQFEVEDGATFTMTSSGFTLNRPLPSNNFDIAFGSNGRFFRMRGRISTGTDASGFSSRMQNSNNFTAASGLQGLMVIEPIWAQTGTAAYTCLLVNSTETTVGSGLKKLLDLQVGTTSFFQVSNVGFVEVDGNMRVTAGGAATVPLLVQGAAAQSANLMEVQDSASAVLAKFDNSGNFFVFGEISVRASGGAAGSEQFGEGASATGLRSTAVGFNANTNKTGGVALGDAATSTGFTSVSLGADSDATQTSTTAVGNLARATSLQSTSIGHSALASGSLSSAFGELSAASGTNSLAVGQAASAGSSAVAVGKSALANSQDAVAVGQGSFALSSSAIALGGGGANANTSESMALGHAALVIAAGGVALGKSAKVDTGDTNSVAIGKDALTTAAQRVTLGRVGGTSAQLQELQVSDGFSAFGATPPSSQPVAITDVAGTADGTYSTNEQDMINDLQTAVNSALAVLRGAGLIAT